jgi:hypothetical protein
VFRGIPVRMIVPVPHDLIHVATVHIAKQEGVPVEDKRRDVDS